MKNFGLPAFGCKHVQAVANAAPAKQKRAPVKGAPRGPAAYLWPTDEGPRTVAQLMDAAAGLVCAETMRNRLASGERRVAELVKPPRAKYAKNKAFKEAIGAANRRGYAVAMDKREHYARLKAGHKQL